MVTLLSTLEGFIDKVLTGNGILLYGLFFSEKTPKVKNIGSAINAASAQTLYI